LPTPPELAIHGRPPVPPRRRTTEIRRRILPDQHATDAGILGTLARNAPDSEHKPICAAWDKTQREQVKHLSNSSQDVSPKPDITDKGCPAVSAGDAATCTDGDRPAGRGRRPDRRQMAAR